MRYLVLICLCCGCSTWNKKTLAYMGGAFVAGSLAGAIQTPEGDNQYMHGLQWGAVGAAATGAILVALHDEPSQLKKKDKELESLKIKLSLQTKEKKSGASEFLESSFPKELKGLVRPGSWKLFEIDEWKESENGEFVHSDRVLEFNAPKVEVTR